MTKLFQNYFVFLLLLLFVSFSEAECKSTETEEKSAELISDSLWQVLRSYRPHHFQAITLIDDNKSNLITIIISEPPPHTKIEELEAIASSHGIAISNFIKTTQIGYDGWSKDIVQTIIGKLKTYELEMYIKELNQYLFHSDYKYDYFHLEDLSQFLATDHLENLAFSPMQLDNLLFSEGKYFPVLGGDTLSINQIISAKAYGCYFSVQVGFVIWVLPTSRSLSEYKEAARQFTLDTDYIIGGVTRRNTTIIIGRERQILVSILPPLRYESLAILATTHDDELAQSYERNNLFAGKIINNQDWAPILLSPELHDQEFGSLLNITDQLLKSWSLNNQVDYINFDYHNPNKWCFKGGIMEELGVNQLTFNWNTKGGFYKTAIGSNEYLLGTNTGALPLSYIPNENTVDLEALSDLEIFENRAHECFINWKDPNIARVLQYTTFYQICQAFAPFNSRLGGSTQNLDQDHLSFGRPLLSFIEELCERIISADSPARQEELAIEAKENILLEYAILFGYSIEQLLNHYDVSDLFNKADFLASLKKVRLKLIKCKERLNKHQYRKLMSLVVNPNYARSLKLSGSSLDPLVIEDINIYESYEYVIQDFQKVGRFLTPKEEAKDSVVSYYKNIGTKWLKTPSIVVSTTSLGFGGHNIGTKVPKIVIDENLSKGSFKISRTKTSPVLSLSPDDYARISPNTVKTLLRDYNINRVEDLIGKSIKSSKTTLPSKSPVKSTSGFYRGYVPNRLKRRYDDWLTYLGYDNASIADKIKSFQKNTGIENPTGRFDLKTVNGINEGIENLRQSINRIGFRKKSLEELIDYTIDNISANHGLSRDKATSKLSEFVQMENQLLDDYLSKIDNVSGVSFNRLSPNDDLYIINNKKFLVTRRKSGVEVLEIDNIKGGSVIQRSVGQNGLKILESEINLSIKSSSKEGVLFARLNSFQSNAEVTIQVGDQTFTIGYSDFSKAMHERESTFYNLFMTFLKDKDLLKNNIVFVVDDIVANSSVGVSEISEGKDALIPMLTDVFGGSKSKFANPYKVVSYLNRHQGEEALLRDKNFVRFEISKFDLDLARANAKSMTKIHDGFSIGFLTDGSETLKDGNLLRFISRRLKIANIDIHENPDKLSSEKNNIVVITGHKELAYKDYVTSLAVGGYFKDRYVVLLSCFNKGESAFNTTVIKKGGAKGILFFDETIQVSAVKRALDEFSILVSDDPNVDIYELWNWSIKNAILKLQHETEQELRNELLKLFQGIFQLTFKDQLNYDSNKA